MSVVRAPTLFVGVDDLGEEAVQRLLAEVRTLGEVPVGHLLIRPNEDAATIQERARAAIDALVRTRLGGVGRGRLDVCVLGDLLLDDGARHEVVVRPRVG